MRTPRLLLLLSFAALVGCRSYDQPDLTPRAGYRFRLGPRDLVRVTVWGRPELLTETEIAPDGKVALPLAGVIPVGDLTLEESAERIGTRLKEFIRDPIVTIELREVRSAQIHVVGEVRVPGTVPFHQNMTFLEAIQRSGGYVHETADVDEFLLVRNSTGGAKQVFSVDMDDLLRNPSGARDPGLEPGDVVFVPPRAVTRFARWIRQAMAPLDAITGGARTASYMSTVPRPY